MITAAPALCVSLRLSTSLCVSPCICVSLHLYAFLSLPRLLCVSLFFCVSSASLPVFLHIGVSEGLLRLSASIFSASSLCVFSASSLYLLGPLCVFLRVHSSLCVFSAPLQRRLSSSRSAFFYVFRHPSTCLPLSASLCVLTGRNHPASLCREKLSACFCVFLLISACLCVSVFTFPGSDCAFSAFFCVSLLYISLLYVFSKSLSVSRHLCISVRLFVPLCLSAPSTSLCVSLGVTPLSTMSVHLSASSAYLVYRASSLHFLVSPASSLHFSVSSSSLCRHKEAQTV